MAGAERPSLDRSHRGEAGLSAQIGRRDPALFLLCLRNVFVFFFFFLSFYFTTRTGTRWQVGDTT